MDLYKEIKQQLNIKDVIEHYGVKVDRYNHFRCPNANEHKNGDKHPSASIKDDYFNCFTCKAGGDVTKFVALYFNISNYDAALKLIDDFNLDIKVHEDKRTKTTYIKPFIQQKTKLSGEWKEAIEHIDGIFSNYYRLLRYIVYDIYRDNSNAIDDDVFAAAVDELPTIEYYLTILDDELSEETIKELYKRSEVYESKFYKYISAICGK